MIRLLIALAALSFALPALAEDSKVAGRKDFESNPLDNKFLAAASECANCQCGLADLVEKRSSRADVKSFARTLDVDHKAMLKELAETIKNRKIAVVAGTSKKDKERCAEVKKLEGKDFDERFLKEVIADHEKAISMCKNQIKNGKDKEVTEFATTALKKLREHLKQAKKLQA